MKFGDLDVDVNFAKSVDIETFISRLSNHSLCGVKDKRKFLSEIYDRLNPIKSDVDVVRDAKDERKRVKKDSCS